MSQWSDSSEDADTVAYQIEESFSSSQLWEFEQVLGNGSFGVTMLLRERNHPLSVDGRRVVLKKPISDTMGVEDLLVEMKILKRLRGSFHIVQLLASCEDLAAANLTTSGLGVLGTPLNAIFGTLRRSGRKGPALLLEYLENGDITKFERRAYVYRAIHGRILTLPNRLVWSFYFCLVRACVGMAYPPELPVGSPVMLETIQPDRQPNGLYHWDIAARNIMIGSRDPGEPPEHRLVPPLKLIDFGLIREDQTQALTIIKSNIYDVSQEIINLISINNPLDRRINHIVFNGITTAASAILPQNNIDPFPNLDPDLRALIAHAMAVRSADRPSLEEMFRRTKQGMEKPASSYPGREQEESDGSIEEILQALIFNA